MFIDILRKKHTGFARLLVGALLLASNTGFTPAAAQQPITTLDVRVAVSSDDAEERASGYVMVSNPDLELVYDVSNQTVGMRFNGIDIPDGATINTAYIQFQVDEVSTDATSLLIQGEAVDNALTFNSQSKNLSSRPKTSTSVAWNPAPWTTVGAAGPDQRTPDITAILQEIMLRPGWVSGNSLVILITGSGTRTAEAYDGFPAAAPLLHVEYTTEGNQIPTVAIISPTSGSTANQGNSLSFSATANDFEDGDLTSSLSWDSDLDGNIGTGGSFSKSNLSVGVHTITATIVDSDGVVGSASTKVTVFAPAAILVGAGDITYDGPRDEATAKLLETIPGTVFTLGDNAYPDGTAIEFNSYYEPTWGRHKARTFPSVGNHDYHTPGASAYFSYFGASAGDPDKGYYSYDLGAWHIIVLNSECSEIGGCGANSPQGIWLQADLVANPGICSLAYFHAPLFSSTSSLTSQSVKDFWTLLYNAEVDVILNGHAHNYERFAPQDPDGVASPTRGIREFVIGTGGVYFSSFDTSAPNSEIRNTGTAGVLKLALNPSSYSWEFLPVPGQTFTDTGSANCVTSSPPPTATPTATSTVTPTSTSSSVHTSTSTITATSTSTHTPTSTATNTPTSTPSATPTSTPVAMPTSTSTATSTSTLTPTESSPASGSSFYASFSSNGSVGGVSFKDEDILYFDGLNWSMYYDGSDIGASSTDIFSIYVVNADTILMSFSNSISFGSWVADPWDIVRFDATSLGDNTAGTFSLYFDGNDVGLDSSSEKIDALELLPDGRLLISTAGSPTVPGLSHLRDEDILQFIPSSLGEVTSGAWDLYFQGSDVGLGTSSSGDINALDVDANGNIYLSTLGNFTASSLSWADEDILVCSPVSLGSNTSCNFSTNLYFDGSAWGLDSNGIDAFNLAN